MRKKRTIIHDNDPNKDFKTETREFLEHEIKYIVSRTLTKTLIWIIIVIVPTFAAWKVADYKRGLEIKEISENWKMNDSIIKTLGRDNYTRNIDNKKYEEACAKVEVLDETKADKVYVDNALATIEKQFDRSRTNEAEMLKRQDLMLKYLLEIKNGK